MMDDYLATCYIHYTAYKRWFNALIHNGRYILYLWHANFTLLNRESLPDDELTDKSLSLSIADLQCALCADSGTDLTETFKKVVALKTIWSVQNLLNAIAYITEMEKLQNIDLLLITSDGASDYALKDYTSIKIMQTKRD